ncbi:MAG TPA: glycosyltransferase family 1 protein, partial [Candidatus Limnocylindrales bacterium]
MGWLNRVWAWWMPHSRVVPPADWRLALDVAPLRAQPAGVGVYVRNLALALAEQLPGRLTLVGARDQADLGGGSLATVPRTRYRAGHYHAWLQLAAARAVRHSGAALAHFTNAGAPLVGGRPFVLTVHDMSVLRMPRHHPWLRLATVPVSVAAIAAARQLVVPSDATADELTRLLRVDRRRVTVVGHAAAPMPPPDGAAEAAVARRHGLEPGSYLLAPGTIEPRKNHARLVAAFELLASAGHDLRLVIAGEVGWRAGALLRRIAASPQRERISRLGYVSDAEMAALLRQSAAVCYVSLYEGYGLPVADAMAAGAAVVTSRVSAMPQVAGGAAVLVDPRDVSAIARGIGAA